MKHDELCPVGTVTIYGPHYCCQSCNPGETPPWEQPCHCELIRRVEARNNREWAEANIETDEITWYEGRRHGLWIGWAIGTGLMLIPCVWLAVTR